MQSRDENPFHYNVLTVDLSPSSSKANIAGLNVSTQYNCFGLGLPNAEAGAVFICKYRPVSPKEIYYSQTISILARIVEVSGCLCMRCYIYMGALADPCHSVHIKLLRHPTRWEGMRLAPLLFNYFTTLEAPGQAVLMAKPGIKVCGFTGPLLPCTPSLDLCLISL